MLEKSSRIIVPRGSCLVIQSTVAKKLGRTNALFLQQLHYKITSGDSVGVVFEGRRWVYNTYQDWVDDIKTISKSTIKRAIAFLKSKGIITCMALSKNKAMRVNYYTINYDCLNDILGLTKEKEPGQSTPMEIKNESMESGCFPHRAKMAPSSGQNDPMSYTEITPDIKTNTSDEKPPQGYLTASKTNKSKQVIDIKENYLAKSLIDIWAQVVEQGKGEVHLTKKRAQFLLAAFNFKFEKSMEKWKKYCQDITSSRFLMGEIKSSFRATLDWALKFEVIQKILEGNFGIGDRNPPSVPSAAESFIKNSKVELDSVVEEIQQTTGESDPVRAFRVKWLKKFGASNYREALKDCGIEMMDAATLILRPSSRYNAKSIASYWTPTLLEDSPFVQVHIFQQEGDLVFDKWFGMEQSRVGATPENDGVEVKDSLDLTVVPIVQSLSETTNIVEEDAVSEKSPEDANGLAMEDTGGQVSATRETQMLREKLRQSLPKNQLPSWLDAIEVESIGQDGTVVVSLEDSLAVHWCQSRFSNEILQSTKTLWSGVNRLIIREKEGDATQSSIENPSKKPENVEEKSTFEQAIQSLLMVVSQPQACFPMTTARIY